MMSMQDTEAVHIQADEEQVKDSRTCIKWEFGYHLWLSRSRSLYCYCTNMISPFSGTMSECPNQESLPVIPVQRLQCIL
jgi:hypothetical protein